MLNFSQFKFHLARYAEVSEADAELFMNTVTQLLLEQLKAGEEVTIQGLGTFSVVETQQGRRLAFQVDEKMRAQVNAPFACFEPMTLAIKKEKEPTPSQPPRGEESIPVEEATPVEETAVEETAPAVEDTPSEVEEAAPVAEEPAPKEEPAPEPAEPELVAQSKPAAETPSAPVAPVVPPTPEKTPEAKTPAATPQPKPRPTKKVEPTWQEQLVEKLKPLLEKAEQQTHLKPWMLGAIAGGVFLILLIIIFAVSCGGSKEKKVAAPSTSTELVNDSTAVADSADVEVPAAEKVADKAPEATAKKPADKKQTAAKSSASTTKSASKPVRSSSSYVHSSPFTSDERPSADILLQEGGRPKQVKLSEGERLTLLALEHYGDKAFWAYIYDVNAFQLGDPNNVPTTVSLYLPDPTYFKIDANDPASVKRAQNRAMQILNDKQDEGPWGRR